VATAARLDAFLLLLLLLLFWLGHGLLLLHVAEQELPQATLLGIGDRLAGIGAGIAWHNCGWLDRRLDLDFGQGWAGALLIQIEIKTATCIQNICRFARSGFRSRYGHLGLFASLI
jgi:hypothetical protein